VVGEPNRIYESAGASERLAPDKLHAKSLVDTPEPVVYIRTIIPSCINSV